MLSLSGLFYIWKECFTYSFFVCHCYFRRSDIVLRFDRSPHMSFFPFINLWWSFSFVKMIVFETIKANKNFSGIFFPLSLTPLYYSTRLSKHVINSTRHNTYNGCLPCNSALANGEFFYSPNELNVRSLPRARRAETLITSTKLQWHGMQREKRNQWKQSIFHLKRI